MDDLINRLITFHRKICGSPSVMTENGPGVKVVTTYAQAHVVDEAANALASRTSALAERDAEIARLKAENKKFKRALDLIASAVTWVIDEDINRPVEVAMDEEEMANIARGALQPVELPHA